VLATVADRICMHTGALYISHRVRLSTLCPFGRTSWFHFISSSLEQMVTTVLLLDSGWPVAAMPRTCACTVTHTGRLVVVVLKKTSSGFDSCSTPEISKAAEPAAAADSNCLLCRDCCRDSAIVCCFLTLLRLDISAGVDASELATFFLRMKS